MSTSITHLAECFGMVDQPLTYRSAMNHARRMADALFLLDTKAKIAAMPAQAWNEYRTALST
ncbi:hypothetical protein PLEOSDRAFT_1110099 [Pleurotus ostreatus PC15]|uniref:Uncharacterized protein n=1 Tax=Pleurotus ostreatus (strain PC15) TaxID=1137138 RepID=A0A067NDX9_PLEO1|nr:hypothetical protein PLEOSDRAFT_1110099 [Pleurotus ostreatus PC15]